MPDRRAIGENTLMPFRIPGAAILPVWRAPTTTANGSGRDRLDQEVVDLFDRFRDPLLRYLLSCGFRLWMPRMSSRKFSFRCFSILNSGKSRENLRGWLFRVAHNLALKRRYRTRRES